MSDVVAMLGRGTRTLFVAAVLAMFGLTGQAAEAGQPAAPSVKEPDAQRLVGRWVRPDGGYILDLRDAAQGGNLKATYFNPQPIHVAKAEWRRKDGALLVVVELRDVNYPGSTYTLEYDPGSDRLTGKYFQAVEKRTFSVEFARSQ